MQQRQPRLGDILDDYCPRERRLTNHVVVAMIGDDVKQTRCTTCDADHEYKHAAVPRQRKKPEQSALYSQVLAGVTPKRIAPPVAPADAGESVDDAGTEPVPAAMAPVAAPAGPAAEFDALFALSDDADGNEAPAAEEGPLHRRLIRAQLPRHEGQVATTRQMPDFTIRQPNPGRPKRFGGRPTRGGGSAQFQGNHSAKGAGQGSGNARGGQQRQGGRPGPSRHGSRHGGGRNKTK